MLKLKDGLYPWIASDWIGTTAHTPQDTVGPVGLNAWHIGH